MSRNKLAIPMQSHNLAISRQIEYARLQLLPYSDAFVAPWLLSSFDSHEWLLRTPRTRLVDNEWQGVVKINWNCCLADGSMLTNTSNSIVLTVAKKICFLFMNFSERQTISTLRQLSSDILTIIKWMYLHKSIYNPQKYGFKLLEDNSIRLFMQQYMNGGTAETLNYFSSILKYFYQNISEITWLEYLQRPPYQVPLNDLQHIISWLKENNFYIKTSTKRKNSFSYLCRKKIAAILKTEHNNICTEKINAFLRQFEPDLQHHQHQLLLPTDRGAAEYPSHRTKIISDIISAPLSLSSGLSMLMTWEYIFRSRHHSPEYLPSSNNIKFSQIRRSVIASSTPIEKTPWIPLKISLTYTNEALRIISCYGKTLVQFYLTAVQYFSQNLLLEKPNEPNNIRVKNRNERNQWIKNNIPAELLVLNINTWTSCYSSKRLNSFKKLRESPSLPDLISILIGSVIILTTTMKPMRTEELALLTRDCVFFKKGDGYYLNHSKEKQGSHNIFDDCLRPIPHIVAKALELLRDIGDGLKSITEEKEPFALKSLMYFSGLCETASMHSSCVDRRFLMGCIDRFCDWVNLPPDSYGRRWYYRIHEGRKSFLISFFWCFKYASLGAASWIAGHKQWQETLTYIQANFPGEELPEFEAQYAAEQLWQYDHNRETEAVNVQELYQAVCKHFKVNQINLICEDDLKFWLTTAFKEKFYLITPIIIGNTKMNTAIEVAFHIKKEQSHGENKKQ